MRHLMVTLPLHNHILRVKVTPNASVTRVVSIEDDVVCIAVAAPPEKDKANKALLKFLKKKFGINCRIRSGQTGRIKVLEVANT